ncbi:peptidase S8, partial [Acinetobacter johnsonii]
SDFALPSRTTFYAVGGDWRLNAWASLVGEVGVARSEISGSFLSMDRAAISSNWRVGLLGDCRLVCDRISFTLSQPLRIESGSFSALLADVPL